MSTLEIGIVGCSSPTLDKNAAEKLLTFGIETAVADHANVTSVKIVTRITYLDTLAWKIAEKKGYSVRIRRLTFLDSIDVIVRVGDDEWSRRMVEDFTASGGTVYGYELVCLPTPV